jgi:3-methyladenine DNA glycosylase AlkC
MRLPEFQKDPTHTLPLLEVLKDDPALYVRRSVANHLADIAKDHLDFAFDVSALSGKFSSLLR